MGEVINLSGLQVSNVYSDGSTGLTTDFNVSSNTFRAGASPVTISARSNSSLTASFQINVSDQLMETGLPVIYIETQNSQSITSKYDYVNGTIMVSQSGSVLHPAQTMQIKGRGNATWDYSPKKPYRIKLDSDAGFLGMNIDKDWVLLANYNDKTLMRVGLGFQLSKAMGFPWTPEARFVELVLNGQYVGNYQLVEHIEEKSSKVNVSDLMGSIFEWDNYYDQEPIYFTTQIGRGYSFKHPDPDKGISDERFNNIKNYIHQLENVLASDDFNDPHDGYQKYIDIESFARWFLFQNILANIDPNWYITKYDNTASSKLLMGPVWDFDWSLGVGWYSGPRPRPANYWVTSGWYYSKLLKDSAFVHEVQNQWNTNKEALKQVVLNYISQTRSEIYESQKLNFRRWDVLRTQLAYEVGGIPLGSFDAELDCDIQFFNNHHDWLNDAIMALDGQYVTPPYDQTVAGAADPLAGKLLILQVYGTGAANDGAVSHSFIELYNNTDSPVNLNGYSLQYANTTGTNWIVINLTGTIPAKGSYLVRGNNYNTSGRLQLTTADQDADFYLNNNGFKVALMGNQKRLTVINPFAMTGGKAEGYVDLVGAANGSDPDAFETAIANVISKQAAARRKNLTDTDNNSADFERIDYRSSATNNETLEVRKPRTSSAGQWNPFAAPETPVVGTESLKLMILQANTYGNDNGGGGGFPSSLVELYNNTNAPINLSGYYLHIGTNNAWTYVIPLSKTIPAKSSFLVESTTDVSNNGSRAPLPAADISDVFVIANSNFKIALMRNQSAPLFVANPFTDASLSADYVDMLGVGSANGYETTATSAASRPQARRRISLADTDNNSVDFGNADYRGGVLTEEQLNKIWPRNVAAGPWNPIP